MSVSRVCGQGDHGFCTETRVTCDCEHCHLGPCEVCDEGNLLKIYDLDGARVCASCYRAAANETRCHSSQPCDRCHAPGAWRNPRHRRNEYLCGDCHRELGEPVVLTPSVAHLAAPCKGKDLGDPAHNWVHVRGSRFRCVCGFNKYDSALRARVQRKLENELF